MRRGDKILLIVLALLVLAWLPIRAALGKRGGEVAVVTLNGQVVREIRLNEITEPVEFTVTTADGQGYNIVRAEPGRIRVTEANCPEQIDVLQGWISHPGQSIICLPHRLVIKITGGKSDVDSIIR
ncbi:MAG: NusG domain II-containing protein [Chloroflexota bacterium]